jgi:phosphoglycolate phosphatase-like HAD superfamily hydrolase
VPDLLVLWDVDYTLLNARGLGNRLYEVVFRQMFGRELPAVAPKAGRTDRAIIRDTLTLAGIPEPLAHVDDFLAALARQVAEVDGTMNTQVHALPGAAAALAALAGPGIRQSVLTGNIRPLAALKLGAAGLTDHLDLDVGAYGDVDEVRAELVPVARLAASQAYRADFGGWSTVMVGDTPLDVEAALAADARAVGVATGTYSEAELAAAGAHAVLPDLTDAARVRATVIGVLLARRRFGFGFGSAGPARRLLARRGKQAAFERGGHRGRAAGHPKLAERAEQVRLHRRLTDAKLTADLGVGAPPCDPGQDLGLPAGKRLTLRPPHVGHQPFGDRGRQYGLAARGGSYRIGEPGLAGVLEQVAGRARLDRPQNIGVGLVSGQHEHPRRRVGREDLRGGRHAVAEGHPQVHQDHVVRAGPGQRHRFGS